MSSAEAAVKSPEAPWVPSRSYVIWMTTEEWEKVEETSRLGTLPACWGMRYFGRRVILVDQFDTEEWWYERSHRQARGGLTKRLRAAEDVT